MTTGKRKNLVLARARPGPVTMTLRHHNTHFSTLTTNCTLTARAMKILVICNVLPGCRLHFDAVRWILGNTLIFTTLALGNIIVLKARSHIRRINGRFTHTYVGWLGKSFDGTGWLQHCRLAAYNNRWLSIRNTQCFEIFKILIYTLND